jgi:hypothetical protein
VNEVGIPSQRPICEFDFLSKLNQRKSNLSKLIKGNLSRGGARAGAGRHKGSLTKRTREIAEKAIAEGITPLEVMLRAMKEHVDAKRWDQASAIAKDAAPYVHPRLAAVEHAGKDGGPHVIRIGKEFDRV